MTKSVRERPTRIREAGHTLQRSFYCSLDETLTPRAETWLCSRRSVIICRLSVCLFAANTNRLVFLSRSETRNSNYANVTDVRLHTINNIAGLWWKWSWYTREHNTTFQIFDFKLAQYLEMCILVHSQWRKRLQWRGHIGHVPITLCQIPLCLQSLSF